MAKLPDGADALLPNALLIVAAIDALNATGKTRSPVSDEVGYAIGTNASWVRRHAKGLGSAEWPASPSFAHLSTNGHCSLEQKGRELVRLLRTSVPEHDAPRKCGYCGAPQAGPGIAGRQIYACGRVMQWCPDHVPGHPRVDIPERSRKAQHSDVWFRAVACGEFYQGGHWSGGYSQIRGSMTSDGVELVPGSLVSANRGSGYHGLYGTVVGTVVAAANGTVLVDWPAVEAEDEWRSRPEVRADLIEARHLITPGAPDETGLSDYQRQLWSAIRHNRILLEINEDGTYGGRFGNRRIVQRALEVLIEHRLLDPPPVPAAVGLSDFQLRLRLAVFIGDAKLFRNDDGSLSAIFEGRRVKPEVLERLARLNLLPAERVPFGREPRAAA